MSKIDRLEVGDIIYGFQTDFKTIHKYKVVSKMQSESALGKPYHIVTLVLLDETDNPNVEKYITTSDYDLGFSFAGRTIEEAEKRLKQWNEYVGDCLNRGLV